jgi:hypothetical protein
VLLDDALLLDEVLPLVDVPLVPDVSVDVESVDAPVPMNFRRPSLCPWSRFDRCWSGRSCRARP